MRKAEFSRQQEITTNAAKEGFLKNETT